MQTRSGHPPAPRVLAVVAFACIVLTGVATWLVHGSVAQGTSSGAVPVIWLGLASIALELVLAVWGIRQLLHLEAVQARAHQQFLGAVVHDVRQPLQAATLFVDSLIHAPQGVQHMKLAKSLDRSLHAVRHTLDGFLELASLEAGVVQVHAGVFSLNALLQALEADFAPRAVAADLRACLFCPSTDISLHGDPHLVGQIIRNLLVHAVASTRQGGVLLGVRQGASQVRVQVWDTRTDTVADKKADRGLVVAGRLATLLNVPLMVESRLGRMTVSTLTLPRA